MKKILVALLLLIGLAAPVSAQFSRITSVTLRNSDNTQAAFYTSPYTMKLGANCTWVISGTTATLNCAGGAAASVPFSGITGSTNTTAAMVVGTGASLGVSGTGTVTANRTTGLTTQEILYNNANTIASVTGLIQGTAADCDGDGTPCALKFTHGATSTFTFVTIPTDAPADSYGAIGTSSADATANVVSQLSAYDGTDFSFLNVSTNQNIGVFGSPFIASTIFKTCVDSACNQDYADAGQIRSANNQSWCAEANPTGTDNCLTLGDTANNATLSGANKFTTRQLESTVATGTAPLIVASTTVVANLNASSLGGATFAAPGAIGGGTPSTGTFTTLTAALYASTTNCADSAGDAACGAAPAGSVVVDATDTTTVVSTTAVTANSEIFVEYDSSLGTRLGVTCNVIAALPAVTARTAATSFTITLPAAPVTNPACYSYHIIN